MIKQLDSKFKGLFDVALIEWNISDIKMWSPAGSFSECDIVIEEPDGKRIIGVDYHFGSATVVFGRKTQETLFGRYESIHSIVIGRKDAKNAKAILTPKRKKFLEAKVEKRLKEKYQNLLDYLGE